MSTNTKTFHNSANMNSEIKSLGLWLPGTQFLSKSEKEQLLNTKDVGWLEQLISTKQSQISQKLSSMERKWSFSEENTKTGINILNNENLHKFLSYKVHEQPVFWSLGENEDQMIQAEDHKALVNQDGQIIHVCKQSYKLVNNEDIVLPLLEQLDKYDNKWYVDESHSFLNEKKMRLQITFPELTLNDGESDVAMSLFLHNSFDGSEGVKLFWGAIREICQNGMIFGTILAKFYARHTKQMNITNIQEQLETTYKLIPELQARIDLMKIKEYHFEKEVITKTFGAKATAYFEQEKTENMNVYDALNIMTYYISHYVHMSQRAQSQRKLAHLFNI